MAIEFRQDSTLGEGAFTRVLKNRRPFGKIYRPPDGVYRFYVGDQEKLGAADLWDPNLELLKAKIQSKYA